MVEAIRFESGCSKMRISRAQDRGVSLIRKIAAGAVLCLFILRALSSLGLAAHFAAGIEADDPVFAAAAGLHCEAPQDPSSPPKQGKDHSQCCVLCASMARGGFALDLLILTHAIVFPPPETPAFFPSLLFIGSQFAKPPGWMANWSATSPPSAMC